MSSSDPETISLPTIDNEIAAMATMADAIESFAPSVRSRMLTWLLSLSDAQCAMWQMWDDAASDNNVRQLRAAREWEAKQSA